MLARLSHLVGLRSDALPRDAREAEHAEAREAEHAEAKEAEHAEAREQTPYLVDSRNYSFSLHIQTYGDRVLLLLAFSRHFLSGKVFEVLDTDVAVALRRAAVVVLFDSGVYVLANLRLHI